MFLQYVTKENRLVQTTNFAVCLGVRCPRKKQKVEVAIADPNDVIR